LFFYLARFIALGIICAPFMNPINIEGNLKGSTVVVVVHPRAIRFFHWIFST
jgi:hypothetical protein